MKRLVMMIALAGIAAGAGATKFSKPGGTQEQFEADKNSCIAQARAQTAALDGTRPANPQDTASRPGERASQAEERIALICMESRGYVWDKSDI